MEQITKKQFVEKYASCKVYVGDKGTQILKQMLKAGFVWDDGTDDLIDNDHPYVLMEDGRITTACLVSAFYGWPYREVKAEEILDMEIVAPTERQFEPFEKVLVREETDEVWQCDFFSHHAIDPEDEYLYHCVGGSYDYCIPYKGNKRLLGTTDAPSGDIDEVFAEEYHD